MIRFFVWISLAGALAGCQDDPHDPQAGPVCGQGCVPPSMVAGGGPGAGSGGGAGTGAGAGGGGDGLEGTVHLIVDEAFSQTQPFAGQAKITAPAGAGQSLSVDYGGTFGTSFELGASPGPVWVLVADDVNSEPLVYSSITAQVAPDASVLLPVVDPALIASIAATLTPGAPVDGKAHVYLEVRRGGSPLSDVSVLGSAGNATIAYDNGIPGSYSDQALNTGTAGRIFLLNADASAAAGTLEISLQDPDGVIIPISLVLRSDTVTIAGFEI